MTEHPRLKQRSARQHILKVSVYTRKVKERERQEDHLDQEEQGARIMNRPSPPTAAGVQLQQARGRRRSALRRERRDDRCERYAASKWGAAPAAAALPPPPTHWRREGRCRPEPDRALPLKLLLNVTA